MQDNEFYIDEQFFCSVSDDRIGYKVNMDNPSPEDLELILRDEHIAYKISGHTDHDEFTKLRNQLSKLGFIKIATTYWNGDRVLRPFQLNGHWFLEGDKFPCAEAMKFSLPKRIK